MGKEYLKKMKTGTTKLSRKDEKKKNKKPVDKKAEAKKSQVIVDDADDALTLAKDQKKDILILVTQESCPPCKAMKAEMKEKKVKRVMKNYIFLKDHKGGKDDHPAYLGSLGKHVYAEGNMIYTPTMVIVTKDGNLKKKYNGPVDSDSIYNFLK